MMMDRLTRSGSVLPISRPGRRAILLAAILLGTAGSASAQVTALDLRLAREPASVTTTAQREFTGLLDGFREGRLFIRVIADGGEVGYSFAPTEVEKLVLPGADVEAEAMELWDRGSPGEALPRLEALGRQRLRYLPVLNSAQRQLLFTLVQASARAGNPVATIGYVNRLLPEAKSAGERAILRDAQLDAHLQLGNTGEVRELAEAWCAEADPAGSSALGWKILAQLAYDAGDFSRARWLALQPVVFSSYQPMEQLDRCYALAVCAAHRLHDGDHALLLYREMLARGVAWPGEPAYAAIGQIYAALVTQPPAPAGPPAPAPPVEDPRPPSPTVDQPQPIDRVRKLVSPPAH